MDFFTLAPHKPLILRSRDIRKCEGAFQVLFDLDLKAGFYKDLNQILGEADFTIIGAGINKDEHTKKYGKEAKDPYSLSLSFVIERLIFLLDNLDKKADVDIKIEQRGKKEDTLLLAHFNSILDRGTYFVTRERLRERITSFKFCTKRENITGLQIADLSAYPSARYVINPKEPYVPFDILKGKIYCNKKREFEGWGLKVFP